MHKQLSLSLSSRESACVGFAAFMACVTTYASQITAKFTQYHHKFMLVNFPFGGEGDKLRKFAFDFDFDSATPEKKK